jgi:hypothetical protein
VTDAEISQAIALLTKLQQLRKLAKGLPLDDPQRWQLSLTFFRTRNALTQLLKPSKGESSVHVVNR